MNRKADNPDPSSNEDYESLVIRVRILLEGIDTEEYEDGLIEYIRKKVLEIS